MDERKIKRSDEETIAVISPSASLSDSSPAPVIDREAEKRLVRKIDRRVMPILFIIYFFNFIDRSNIGNAKIQGMDKDLDLVGSRYNTILFVFFISYILFEVPSNSLLRFCRPSLYISGLVFCWGITAMCMGFVHSYKSLAGLRFMLGCFEAGLLPGIAYYTSFYYRRFEYQTRLIVMTSGAGFSGAFGGFLAYAISHMDGLNGYRGWRWIFILEGGVTAVVAIAAYFIIVDFPDQASFLSPQEKSLLRARLARDGVNSMDRLTRKAAVSVATDPKIWLTGGIMFGGACTAYSISFFLPTILDEMGWHGPDAQVHTIPPHMVALCAGLALAVVSDRVRHRYAFVIAGPLLSTVGSIMLLNQRYLSTAAKYAATFLISTNVLSSFLGLAWMMNNLGGHWKRAGGSAIAVSVGNFGGILASNIFLVSEKPYYKTGYLVSMAASWVGIICSTIQEILLYRENKKRERGDRDYRLLASEAELSNMGDDHPSFRYTL